MISNELIQTALIEKLQQSPLLSGVVLPSNILEDEYQGQQFTYPSIRVSIESQTPLGNAVGRTKLSVVQFDIIIFSEKPSSLECNRIGGYVMNSLFNGQIKGRDPNKNPNHFIFNRIDIIVEGKALRVAERLWEKIISFQSEMYVLS